jgi:hypothetical protein
VPTEVTLVEGYCLPAVCCRRHDHAHHRVSGAITDAAGDEKVTTIFCTPVIRNPRCPDCGCEGCYRDTVTRPLNDLPVAGYPLVLRVAVPPQQTRS